MVGACPSTILAFLSVTSPGMPLERSRRTPGPPGRAALRRSTLVGVQAPERGSAQGGHTVSRHTGVANLDRAALGYRHSPHLWLEHGMSMVGEEGRVTARNPRRRQPIQRPETS